jgi:hypothetical protein
MDFTPFSPKPLVTPFIFTIAEFIKENLPLCPSKIPLVSNN